MEKNRKDKSQKGRTESVRKARRYKKKLQSRREEILSGVLVVLMEDECHLLWGDCLGYVWGKKNTQVEVSMTNEKERQTYYGAVNCLTRDFYISPFDKGNGANTVEYVKFLQKMRSHR